LTNDEYFSRCLKPPTRYDFMRISWGFKGSSWGFQGNQWGLNENSWRIHGNSVGIFREFNGTHELFDDFALYKIDLVNISD